MCVCVVAWLLVVTRCHRGLFQGGCVARRGVERLVVQLVQVVLVDAGQAGAVATVQPLVRPHGKRAATGREGRQSSGLQKQELDLNVVWQNRTGSPQDDQTDISKCTFQTSSHT